MIWEMLHTVLLQAALLFIILGCAASLAIGLVMLVKPQWLEAFSKQANRRFPASRPPESRHPGPFLPGREIFSSVFEVTRSFPDRLASHHPRPMALLIIAASLYALFVILPLLFG